MRGLGLRRGLAVLSVVLPASHAAWAASFSVIADVPGGPRIGAVAGTTLYGTVGYAGDGFLFSLSTSGKSYTVMHRFNGSVDGSHPDARLALGTGGDVYGAAQDGGANNGGTLWEYSAAGKMLTRHAFGAGNDGSTPLQGPTMGPAGTVYGATGEGAIKGSGNIFSISPAGAYTVLYDFMSKGDGHCPFSGVAFGPHGALYGTTVGVGGGGNPNGSVWRYTTAGGLKTLYVFKNDADGEWPDQAPVLDAAGNVYGTTYIRNGAQFAGAIWKISAAGVFSVMHVMNAATDGFAPNSPLMLDTNGKLYGTTSSQGPAGHGTVFGITKAGIFAVVHAFANKGDGAQPTGNLVHDSHGTIYGGTDYGPVFKVAP